MPPMMAGLAGIGIRVEDKSFIAWFGLRGLQTIVFGLSFSNEKPPGNDTIIAVAGCTVLLKAVRAHATSAATSLWPSR